MNPQQSNYEDSKIIPAYNLLKAIKGIHFTPREIDIISCIITGRTYKTISSLLSISPTTVECHVRNIMLKLGCGSRENIIDFIEKSDKLLLVRNHYVKLLIKTTFELQLKKISALKGTNINCLIFYYKNKKMKDPIIHELQKHLSIAGIKTLSKVWKEDKVNNFLLSNLKTQQIDYVIYVISNEFAEQFKKINYLIQEEVTSLMSIIKQKSNPLIFLLLNNKKFPEFKKKLANFVCIESAKHKNYYVLVFILLKTLLPFKNFTKNIEYFKKQHTTLLESSYDPQWTEANKLKTGNNKIKHCKYLQKNLFFKCQVIFLVITCFIIYVITKETNNIENKSQKIETKLVNENQNILSIIKNKTIIVNLPPRNRKFTGRKKTLTQIRQQLLQQKFGVITQAISGLGGVGKTQLATEFAYRTFKKNFYKAILWIAAETQNDINNSYREIANALQIDIKGLKTDEVQMLVHNKLIEIYKDSKILFILDNVPNYDNIRNYIETLNKQFPINLPLHILITSRSQYWPESPLILDAFTSEEALMFIKKHLPNEEKNSMLKLAKTLHHFPLALGQAAAYIKAHTNIDDYLELYKTKEKDYSNLFVGEKNQYSESLWKTWYIALSKLNKYAKEILFISAYLYPDAIPIDLFYNLSIEDRTIAIKDLRKHSFIILTHNNKAFKVHRLLQEIIRLNITKKEQSGNTKYKLLFPTKTNSQTPSTAEELWSIKAINLIQKKFSYDYLQFNQWDAYKKYLPHALAVAKHAIAIKKSAFQLGLKLQCQVAMFMTYVQPDLQETTQMWLNILQLIKLYKNKNFVDKCTANINVHLGSAILWIGEVEKANKYLNKAISIYKQHNLSISEKEQEILNNLRFIQLATDISSTEQSQFDLCLALIRLANNSRIQGQHNKTIIYCNEALAALEKCKKNMPHKYYYANILRELGSVHVYAGNFIEAENILRMAKKIVDQNFINHPLQLHVHEALASFMYSIGAINEAKELLENSLKIQLSIFAKLHLKIAHTNMLLGSVNNMCFDLASAEANLKQAEKIYNIRSKSSYYGYIFLYLKYSRLYESKKQYDKALDYLHKTLEFAKLHYGDHVHTAMAFQLSAAEIWPRAEKTFNIKYLEQALELSKQLFGNEHIQIARYHYLLGQANETISKPNIAQVHYKNAKIILTKQKHKHSNLIQINDKNLSLIHKRMGKIAAESY